MRRVVAALFSLVVAAGSLIATPATGQAREGQPQWPEVGSARLVPLQETGPAEERLNLIIMCDGYQQDELGKCREDVDRNQAVQWSVEPFRTYRHYVNVYLLEIVSGESGVRCDPDEEGGPDPDKLTPLRLVYDDGCVDPLSRGTVYNDTVGGDDGPGGPGTALPEGTPTGDEQRTMYLEDYVAPRIGIPADADNLQTLAIFNTFTYGGIGGFHATTSGGSPQGPLISMHELGHSLGTLQDEYPYSSRPEPGPPHEDGEPDSFHHTRMSSEEMTANEAKWWRWLGEESESGGTIGAADADGHESGVYSGSNVWRPSEHSMMRWIGFPFDQVGREHMTGRLAGQRLEGEMNLRNTPEGEVPRDGVLWVETMQPAFHEVDVEWRIGGPDGDVLETADNRYLDLAELDLAPGTAVHAEVRDPVGPDGIDWVRNPSTGSGATDSGYNGPRYVQTRQWTVGSHTTGPDASTPVEFTSWTPDDQPVAHDEVVFAVTAHPRDRVLDIAWRLDGEEVQTPGTARNLDLGALDLDEGTHELTATVTDPAVTDGAPDTVAWTVDNVLPTAPRTLSDPLTTLDDGNVEHPVYFEGWDMRLEPRDDRTGYDGEPFVVGELRLNEDGWYNYFGFPEEPMPDSPFRFRQAGTEAKALIYGNLGTGGLSKAAFERNYGPDDPNGPFVPGYGTHTVEHRAIDPSGNIGRAEEYRATVLPGESPECADTVTGARSGDLVVTEGVVCLENARVSGDVTVRPGASLVVRDSSLAGRLVAEGADVVQLFGSTVHGRVDLSGTTSGITAAGTTFTGAVALTGNAQVPPNQWAERFSEFGHAYGPVLAGNSFTGRLSCTGNSAPAADFEAANDITGRASGDCADL
ncbi:M64 family metallopeptidase [Streptomyces sp. SBT349]|uniref:M64 family metallopeptidase n=1 Tax=Streptomyces sp. SBT349 TaxID=1580539 RepID=UPI00066B7DA2|nr:M64 family metallopeptidase [Streptomyces sp. SBT349]